MRRKLTLLILPLLTLACATFLSAPERELLGRWAGVNQDGESIAMTFQPGHRVQVMRETESGEWSKKGSGHWSYQDGQLKVKIRGEIGEGKMGAAGYLHLIQKSNNRSLILKKED